VFLIRHGATGANRAVPYRLQGRATDLPLDELGRAQAARAAEALQLAGVRPSAVFTSPLLRAFETARVVGAPRGVEPEAVAELVEADVGRWEGLTWDEARARDPEDYRRFHDDPGTVPYPGGESFADVAARVGPAIARLAGGYPGASIVVVGHNVVNRAFLAGPLGLPIGLARTIRQSNGGISLVEYDGPGAPPRVVMLNGCLHLEGLATEGPPPAP
jgi:broad specificity phosphatase PhoE